MVQTLSAKISWMVQAGGLIFYNKGGCTITYNLLKIKGMFHWEFLSDSFKLKIMAKQK